MIEVRTEDSVILLPYVLDDISYKDYRKSMSIREAYLAKGGEVDDVSFEAFLKQYVSCFCDITGIEIGDISKVKAEGKVIEVGDDITVVAFFNHIIFVLSEVSNVKFPYRHNGIDYTIGNVSGELKKDDITIGLDVGEVVESQIIYSEMQRAIEEANKNDVSPIELYPYSFAMEVASLAVIFRPVGHVFPFKKSEQQGYMKDAIKKLDDLPLSVVLAVQAFFLDFSFVFLMTKNIGSTLKGERKILRKYKVVTGVNVLQK